MKMLLDHKPKIIVRRPTVVFLDTETSAFDHSYNALPLPTVPEHRVCIIQFLIDNGEQAKQFVFHLEGYQFDEAALRQRFSHLNALSFKSFPSERSMVDAFWEVIMNMNEQIILTGFNACHDPLHQIGTERKLPEGFCGYDLKWLTARTSWRFTAKN